MASIWPSKSRRDDFFERFRSLIDDFPELAKASTEFQELQYGSPDEKLEDAELGYPSFDAAVPNAVHGIVVILHWRNLDGYEDSMVLEPWEQSEYLTEGLISDAYHAL